jgi:hypothetical protein
MVGGGVRGGKMTFQCFLLALAALWINALALAIAAETPQPRLLFGGARSCSAKRDPAPALFAGAGERPPELIIIYIDIDASRNVSSVPYRNYFIGSSANNGLTQGVKAYGACQIRN